MCDTTPGSERFRYADPRNAPSTTAACPNAGRPLPRTSPTTMRVTPGAGTTAYRSPPIWAPASAAMYTESMVSGPIRRGSGRSRPCCATTATERTRPSCRSYRSSNRRNTTRNTEITRTAAICASWFGGDAAVQRGDDDLGHDGQCPDGRRQSGAGERGGERGRRDEERTEVDGLRGVDVDQRGRRDDRERHDEQSVGRAPRRGETGGTGPDAHISCLHL